MLVQTRSIGLPELARARKISSELGVTLIDPLIASTQFFVPASGGNRRLSSASSTSTEPTALRPICSLPSSPPISRGFPIPILTDDIAGIPTAVWSCRNSGEFRCYRRPEGDNDERAVTRRLPLSGGEMPVLFDQVGVGVGRLLVPDIENRVPFSQTIGDRAPPVPALQAERIQHRERRRPCWGGSPCAWRS